MAVEITRQHDDTLMTEIAGEVCQRFIAVIDSTDGRYHIFYINISDVCHRFFLDAGLLFWRSGENPDEDNDLYGGEGDNVFGVFEYIDLGATYGLVGSMIELIAYRDGRLEMKFSNGARLLFEAGIDDDGCRMIQ